MSKVLDDKLKAVFAKHISSGDYEDEFDALSIDVKQTFADEGKCYMPDHEHLLKNIKDTGLMTGQEWYDRFETELGKEYGRLDGTNHQILNHLSHITRAQSAAKKAAGL